MCGTTYVVVCVFPVITGWSAAAEAQSTSFKYQFTPYFWLSGLSGAVGARDRTAAVDASVGDILSHLDFGLMGAFEARLGRWRSLSDTLYTDVSGEQGFPEPPFVDASVLRQTNN